jgi:hypothetical protein
VIELKLDFSLHYWLGERESQGRASIYRGPLLLTYDRRFNDMDPPALPALDAKGMTGKVAAWPGRRKPMLLLEVPTAGGGTFRLCDFGSAGDGGSPYVSWLPVKNVPATAFSVTNPLRSGRVNKE